ncbi:hypothetical protein BC835DRAFT_1311252 [Cytidiella melzeri]|nr:hypothetical protein BC835DRAFT_1311252 [Cytidiella melzeri]
MASRPQGHREYISAHVILRLKSAMDADALSKLPRRDIQKLAQREGIKANLKSEDIIAQLVQKFPRGVAKLAAPVPRESPKLGATNDAKLKAGKEGRNVARDEGRPQGTAVVHKRTTRSSVKAAENAQQGPPPTFVQATNVGSGPARPDNNAALKSVTAMMPQPSVTEDQEPATLVPSTATRVVENAASDVTKPVAPLTAAASREEEVGTQQQKGATAASRLQAKGKGRASSPYASRPNATQAKTASSQLAGADRLRAEIEEAGLLSLMPAFLMAPAGERQREDGARASSDVEHPRTQGHIRKEATNGEAAVARASRASAERSIEERSMVSRRVPRPSAAQRPTVSIATRRSSSKTPPLLPTAPKSPVKRANKRGHEDDIVDSTYKVSRARVSDASEEQRFAPSGGSDFPERETPPPDADVPTEARAKFILQQLTKKVNESAALSRELEDVQALLAITAAKNAAADVKLKELRRRRVVVERVYMMRLKGDERLHNGTHSWQKFEEGDVERDYSYMRDVSDERDSSDFVASSDPSLDSDSHAEDN